MTASLATIARNSDGANVPSGTRRAASSNRRGAAACTAHSRRAAERRTSRRSLADDARQIQAQRRIVAPPAHAEHRIVAVAMTAHASGKLSSGICRSLSIRNTHSPRAAASPAMSAPPCAAVLLVDHSDARDPGPRFIKQRPRAVARAVVDDHQLRSRHDAEHVPLHVIDRKDDGLLLVVDRHHDDSGTRSCGQAALIRSGRVNHQQRQHPRPR